MKYLIDTQILIWTLVLPNNVFNKVLAILKNNQILVSQISLFEIAIKQKVGKLPELSIAIEQLVQLIKKDGFTILNLKDEHINAYHSIPLLADHRDPFDRLLLATSLFEQIPLISADEKFKMYSSIIPLIENA
ncbi:MAG: type II toxin-antitoxin system VapC family toxin [Microscillaceae bacterium]|jgi:PIN domain nuclease of toxin-antitoxin system|nr:type II toxin-antitoxin system VapC family toxin [Microscillaceae bacterium]